MREDTCARCGARIHLIKSSPMSFKWVTDPEKPDTWKCAGEPNSLVPNEFRRHAPVSAQASHR